jgi:hypothetical protein
VTRPFRQIRDLRPLPEFTLCRKAMEHEALFPRAVAVDGSAALPRVETDKSRRTLALPDVCLVLRAHRTQQLQETSRGRQEVGSYRARVYDVRAPRERPKSRGRVAAAERVAHPPCAAQSRGPGARALPRPTPFGGEHVEAEGVGLVEVSMSLRHSELRVTADLLQPLAAADRRERREAHGHAVGRQERLGRQDGRQTARTESRFSEMR